MAAGCRPSYLSQVLHSHNHLTLDQAASLCAFWSFNKDRTEFFLSLVQLERSGSKALKEHLAEKIKTLRTKHMTLSTRIQSAEKVSSGQDRLAYYSNWYMSAVHILTTIAAYQTPDALAKRLNADKSYILSILDELRRLGFVVSEGERYRSAVREIHVEKGSPLYISNHFQWRTRAMARIVEGGASSVHYSAVHALSRKDIETLRELMLDFIEKSREVVAPSPEEEAVCIACDFFHL